MMTKHDAIAQLQDLRAQARAQIHPRSSLCIQEYVDAGTAEADVAALTMAIRALRAPQRDVPTWAKILWCAVVGAAVAACVIYAAA